MRQFQLFTPLHRASTMLLSWNITCDWSVHIICHIVISVNKNDNGSERKTRKNNFVSAKKLQQSKTEHKNNLIKQVAQLWQRDRAKFDTFLINVQRYSQNHAQNWIFGPPYRGIRAIYALYLKFLKQRNLVAEFHLKNVSFTCKQQISVSEPPFWGGLG